MLATPRSGLYKRVSAPTIREMIDEDAFVLQQSITLPEGSAGIDKTDLCILIRRELGDMQTIYNSTLQFRTELPSWCRMHLPAWTAMRNALLAEYDPLQNYNMTEHETPAETTETESPAETTRTITPAETTETESPAETTRTITPAATTDTERPAEVTDAGDRKDGIFGFDGGSVTPSPADTSEGKTVRTVQTAGSVVRTTQTPGSESLDVDTAGSRQLTVDAAGSEQLTVDAAGTRQLTVDNERTLTRSGNIGVTTSQQMLEAELDLRARWQMLRVYLDDFRREICVGVW